MSEPHRTPMLWEVEIQTKGHDADRQRVADEFDLLTHSQQGKTLVIASARGYLLEGSLGQTQVEQLVRELLVDPVAEIGRINDLDKPGPRGDRPVLHVLLKPGVMDPAAQSVVEAARDLGITIRAVRSLRRYYLNPDMPVSNRSQALPALRRVLANEAIEQIVEGPLTAAHWSAGTPYQFHRVVVPLRSLDDAGLERLSREGQLSLSVAEMGTIQEHFRSLDRDPTDVELETLAQTWSEHCSHKTLKGEIDFEGRRIRNLLKETIFGATTAIRRELG